MSSLEYYEYQKKVYRRKLLIASAVHILKNSSRKKDQRWHVRPIFKERRRLDHYTTLVKEYQLNNSAMFFNFMRMSSSNFEDLVSLVGPLIYRHPYRPDILSPREILSATLR
ncbi:uncharacterized protein LOC111026196 [Myzus persicae]|uniref:uncharacterized protein LOC111026196 n=1 Tax=Myzus persicae TaxID=13164 RepID=UPI000B933057|nr:uncharacterized protein LOC111026196 [Myzus persicae]